MNLLGYRDTNVPGFWGYLLKLLYDFRDTFQNNFRDTGYWGPPFQGLIDGILPNFANAFILGISRMVLLLLSSLFSHIVTAL